MSTWPLSFGNLPKSSTKGQCFSLCRVTLFGGAVRILEGVEERGLYIRSNLQPAKIYQSENSPQLFTNVSHWYTIRSLTRAAPLIAD